MRLLRPPSLFDHPAIARPASRPFAHGVASGDPLPDGAVIWTRVTPAPEAVPGSGIGAPVTVEWVVARDRGLRDVVRRGTVRVDASRDHTVKVDVRGLAPATTYAFGFFAVGAGSPVGRLRTAPDPAATPADLRFGVAACANLESGWFAGYRHLSRRADLDFVLHVGDYVYPTASGELGPGPAIGRVHRPQRRPVSLADHRLRHACYRDDPDLRAFHAAHTVVHVWDGDQPVHPDDPAVRAALEWLPIREQPGDWGRLDRVLPFGTLATLFAVDGRPCANGGSARLHEHERWLLDGLASADTTWRLVAGTRRLAPMLLPPLPGPIAGTVAAMFGLDDADSPRSGRCGIGGERLFAKLARKTPDDTVFVTGASHATQAVQIVRDALAPEPGEPLGVEIGVPSLTSDNFDDLLAVPAGKISAGVEAVLRAFNPHVKVLDLDRHGYSIVELDDERMQIDWFYLADRTDVLSRVRYGQSIAIQHGSRDISGIDTPLPVRRRNPHGAGRSRDLTGTLRQCAPPFPLV